MGNRHFPVIIAHPQTGHKREGLRRNAENWRRFLAAACILCVSTPRNHQTWEDWPKRGGAGCGAAQNHTPQKRAPCTLAAREAGLPFRVRRGFPRGRVVKSLLGRPSFYAVSWAYKKRRPSEDPPITGCRGDLWPPAGERSSPLQEFCWKRTSRRPKAAYWIPPG